MYQTRHIFPRTYSEMPYERKCIFLFLTDGPATINVNIYLRTISRIDDVKMVRGQKNCTVEENCMRHKTVRQQCS